MWKRLLFYINLETNHNLNGAEIFYLSIFYGLILFLMLPELLMTILDGQDEDFFLTNCLSPNSNKNK